MELDMDAILKDWIDNNLAYRVACPVCGHRFWSGHGKYQHYMRHVREGTVENRLHPVCPLRLPNGFFLIRADANSGAAELE